MHNKKYNISTYRTTIAKDVAALQESGEDIVIIHSTQCKYFIGSRQSELPELKLLIAAVESSKFITSKKSDALIRKIHMLTSDGQVKKLKRNNYVSERIKSNNEQIYYQRMQCLFQKILILWSLQRRCFICMMEKRLWLT